MAVHRTIDYSEFDGLLAERAMADMHMTERHITILRGLLAQGQPAAALPILRNFPVSKQYAQAEQLAPLAQAMADEQNEGQPEDDLGAMYANALRLAGRGLLPAAMDGLLELLRADKGYRKGEAHRAAIGLLLLMGEENELTRQYRQELASLLF